MRRALKRALEGLPPAALAALFLGWAAVFSTSTAYAQGPRTPSSPPVTTVQEPRVQADVSSGSYVVPVEVAGRAVSAILDTGSSVTLMDIDFARSIGIAGTEAVAIGGGTEDVSASEAPPMPLRIGHTTVSISPLLLDFETMGIDQEIVLGRELFDEAIVRLNALDRTFQVVSETDAEAFMAQGARLLSLEPTRTALLSIPVAVNGTALRAAVDLGSQVPLFVPSSVAAALGDPDTFSTRALGDISGMAVRAATTADSVSLAGTTLEVVPVVIEDHPQRQGLALLGMPILSRFDLILDFGGRRMWAAPARDLIATPFPRDRLGLALEAREEGWSVLHVAHHSPADKAGIRTGARVRDLSWIGGPTPYGVRAIGEGSAGTVVRVETDQGRFDLALTDY